MASFLVHCARTRKAALLCPNRTHYAPPSSRSDETSYMHRVVSLSRLSTMNNFEFTSIYGRRKNIHCRNPVATFRPVKRLRTCSSALAASLAHLTDKLFLSLSPTDGESPWTLSYWPEKLVFIAVVVVGLHSGLGPSSPAHVRVCNRQKKIAIWYVGVEMHAAPGVPKAAANRCALHPCVYCNSKPNSVSDDVERIQYVSFSSWRAPIIGNWTERWEKNIITTLYKRDQRTSLIISTL